MDADKIYTVRTIQFRPYPETGEFACIGTVIYSLDGGYFNYRLVTGVDRRKVEGRIRGFFPELSQKIFALAHRFVKTVAKDLSQRSKQGDLFVDPKVAVDNFTRARENVIRFSDASVVLCADPVIELKKQYDYAVMRSFVEKDAAYVFKMQKDIKSCLMRAKIKCETDKNIQIKKFDYTVRAPFYLAKNCASRIVKPIDLDKKDVQDILHTIATWSFDARNIKDAEPDVAILCPMRFPSSNRKSAIEAAHEMLADSKELFSVTNFGEHNATSKIVQFMG